jgi:hypothetical protein
LITALHCFSLAFAALVHALCVCVKESNGLQISGEIGREKEKHSAAAMGTPENKTVPTSSLQAPNKADGLDLLLGMCWGPYKTRKGLLLVGFFTASSSLARTLRESGS